MTTLAVSFLERHLAALRQSLFTDVNERAAYVLFGRASTETWEGQDHLLVSHAIEQVSSDAIIASSPTKISWRTSDVLQKLKIAEKRNVTLGIVHTHVDNYCYFSRTDDENEADLIRTIQNRNGSGTHLASVLLTPEDELAARLWTSPSHFVHADELRVVGDHFKIRHIASNEPSLPLILDRQVLALGHAFNRQLSRLRIAIVGCGGTGSAIAMLLARLGVGTIALIDRDTVDESNLNRLHGSCLADAYNHKSKVEVVARSISETGLQTRVIRHFTWISDPDCRDTLKTSHVVFGCTDDNAGRLLLNRFAYAYQIPVIDMGLALQISHSDPPEVQAMDGRVTVLVPGEACLLCRGVIDARRASEESLKRQNPAEYERRKSEAYVLGERNPSPAVVTFTTELACMAVNEMIHRLQGFRGENGSTPSRTRLFHRMTDLRPGCKPDPDCRVCGQPLNWCRGDTEPFLGLVS